MNASDLMLSGTGSADAARLPVHVSGGPGHGPGRISDATAEERAGGAAAFASELRGFRGEAGAGGTNREPGSGGTERGDDEASVRVDGATAGRASGDGVASNDAAARRGDGFGDAAVASGTDDLRRVTAVSASDEASAAAADEIVATDAAAEPDGAPLPSPAVADAVATTHAASGVTPGEGVLPDAAPVLASSGAPAVPGNAAAGLAITDATGEQERAGEAAPVARVELPRGMGGNASSSEAGTDGAADVTARQPMARESRGANATAGESLASMGGVGTDGASGIGNAAIGRADEGGSIIGTPATGMSAAGAPRAGVGGTPATGTLSAEASATGPSTAGTSGTGTAATDASTGRAGAALADANTSRRDGADATAAAVSSDATRRDALSSDVSASRAATSSVGENLAIPSAREAALALPGTDASPTSSDRSSVRGDVTAAQARTGSAPQPATVTLVSGSLPADPLAGRGTMPPGTLAASSVAGVGSLAAAGRADVAVGADPRTGQDGEDSIEPLPVLVADVVRRRRAEPTRRVEVSRLENEAGIAAERRLGSVSLESASLAAAREGEGAAARPGAVSSTAPGASAPIAVPAPGATHAARVDTAPLPTPAATPIAPHNLSFGGSSDAGELAASVRWTLGEGRGQALVNVTPAGLGPVSIRVSLEKEQMNVSILATQPGAREALESLVPRLREQLSAEGHERVQVDVSGGRQDGQGRAGAQAQDEGRSGTGRATGENGDGRDVESLAQPDTMTHDDTGRGTLIARSLVDAWA